MDNLPMRFHFKLDIVVTDQISDANQCHMWFELIHEVIHVSWSNEYTLLKYLTLPNVHCFVPY